VLYQLHNRVHGDPKTTRFDVTILVQRVATRQHSVDRIRPPRIVLFCFILGCL